MPDLPRKKVGLIACSGEEIAAGTLSRAAVRLVLEELRPEDTTTMCLPLFLAGENEERAFARVYPTIAVDGCDKLCAQRATDARSAPVAGSIRVDQALAGDGHRNRSELATRVWTTRAGLQPTSWRTSSPRESTPFWDQPRVWAGGRAHCERKDAGSGNVLRVARDCPSRSSRSAGKAVELVAVPALFEQFYDGWRTERSRHR